MLCVCPDMFSETALDKITKSMDPNLVTAEMTEDVQLK